MTIFMDLETLPCSDDAVIADLAKTIAPPATHKKQETIDKWMEENKESALKDLVARTSFDGMYGRVACIAWACDDGEIHSTLPDDSESKAIERFYDYISFDASSNAFCGHNLHGFDLPFLKHRSIILGIRPPGSLLKAMNAKAWDDCIVDTMLSWSQDKQKRASMDKLCRVLGIDGKGDFDGSMVADEWKNGSKEKVISYCCDDVKRTREIYKRITFTQDSAA